MKTRLSIILLAIPLLLAGCGKTDKSAAPEVVNPFAAAKVGSPETLEVVTWNIENFAKQGDVTVATVRDIIRGLDADVVALQEVASTLYFDRLNEALPEWEGMQSRSDQYQNLAFLVRTGEDLEVLTVGEPVAEADNEFTKRPYVLTITYDGTEIVIINNHFKCCGDNVIDETDRWDEEFRRLNACVSITGHVAALLDDVPVMVVGDLNDRLTDSPSANVFGAFLDDPDHWRFADMAIAQDSRALWSYGNSSSHIDHIAVSDELFPALAGALVQVIPVHTYMDGGWTAYDQTVSDHLPVVIRLVP